MSRHVDEARQVWRDLSAPGKAAVAVGAIALALTALPAYKFVASIIGPRPAVPATAVPEEEALRAEQFERYVGQIRGRSLFHTPAAPGTRIEPPKVSDAPAAPPPPPSVYGGPSLIAMINNEVWFTDGKRLKLGDPAKDDLAVVRMNPPWDATIAWKGVEFKVPLFTREDLVLKEPRPATAPTPAPPAAPTTPPATDPGTQPATDAQPKTDASTKNGGPAAQEGGKR